MVQHLAEVQSSGAETVRHQIELRFLNFKTVELWPNISSYEISRLMQKKIAGEDNSTKTITVFY